MNSDSTNIDSTDGMILRTVFLPFELDQAMHRRAREDDTSGEEVIRRALTNYFYPPERPASPADSTTPLIDAKTRHARHLGAAAARIILG